MRHAVVLGLLAACGDDPVHHLGDAPVVPTTAALFVASTQASMIYRYAITADADPVLTASIPSAGATGMAFGPTGELFVGAYGENAIHRFLTPLATPTANGRIAMGLASPEEMKFVDSELWVVNSDGAGSSTPVDVARFAFDATGTASLSGTVTAGLIGGNRGMQWNPDSRDLYVSQCCSTYAIQHFRVATDGTPALQAATTGGDLADPHAMIVTPWGELLVANAGPYPTNTGTTVLRFTIDGTGGLAPNGAISGNGILFPIGLALAPWGELYIVDASGVIVRFTFDAAHAAVPHGTFSGPPNVNWAAIAY